MIQIQALGSNLVIEQVFVKANNKKQVCICPLESMCPVVASNLPWGERICTTCRAMVPKEMNDAYNRENGFSGYDEHAEGWELEHELEG